jgi:hypothetical protein
MVGETLSLIMPSVAIVGVEILMERFFEVRFYIVKKKFYQKIFTLTLISIPNINFQSSSLLEYLA